MDAIGGFAMFDAAATAFGTLMSFERLAFLWLGVLVGLAIGLLPGIGGLTGFALLVPFTYTMDPFAAFAMLLGMHSVTTTSDTIPAVLFGVPGTAASQATVLDGMPMTRRGEAGRALSAAYVSSLLGGLVGALILGVTLPIVRPLVLAMGTPELLGVTIFGIAMVSALSGKAPLRGLVAACAGILVGMIGTNVQTGQERWTGDFLYLSDGVPMLPVLLGIFALPELCDLAIKKSALTDKVNIDVLKGMRQGAADAFKNWFLILRCSGIGAAVGALPGISGAVADWFAYGHALQTEKGANETFGKGDVRGVIAPESANNAKEGGMLVPVLAFGVPGGAAQAVLLSALMVHGFVPGPDMLTRNLDVTYVMVWSVALANIFGAGLCFALSGQFAKISMLRYTLILPVIMAIVLVGAFQGSHSWGDLFVLLIFGVLGWVMKRLRWPRPPLILGLVLGVLIERYMAISTLRYGSGWLFHPGVLVFLVLSALVIIRPMIVEFRRQGIGGMLPLPKPQIKPEDLLYVFFIGTAAYMLIEAQSWFFNARIGPTVVATTLIVAGSISLIYVVFSRRRTDVVDAGGVHMDISSDEDGVKTPAQIIGAAAIFFGWFLAFLAVMSVIGLIPTVPIMVIAYMRLEGREPWPLSIALGLTMTILVYAVFERLLHVPWPRTFMGEWFPQLAAIIPSM